MSNQNLTAENARTFIKKDCSFGFDTPYADAADRYIRLLIKELEIQNQEPECEHDWVSADNEVTTGVLLCTKCKKIKGVTE